jgi:5'-deoxynucleotidase YfbR-like HD superfamily hydrolase
VHKWIVTAAQKKLDLEHPELFNWDIEVIAHSLAHINRYTGHAPWAYSVAQHAFLVGVWLYQETNDAMIALCGLHHDDHEIVTGDMSSPMKHWLKEHTSAFSDFGIMLDATIEEKLGLQDLNHPLVKEADTRIAITEKNAFFPLIEDKWQSEQEGFTALPVAIEQWTPERAKFHFISLHQRLSRRIERATS